jgi:UDP-2,3-diacylglucosamine pyrophosphatase LpxH
MKLQVMSDLHLECFFDLGSRFLSWVQPAAPTLFLAGDIQQWRDTERVMDAFEMLCRKWHHVFFVPGNHDYWTSEYGKVNRRLKAAESAFKNLTWLRSGRVIEYEGKRILGDTMWFPFDVGATTIQYAMEDFKLISGMTPAIYDQNAAWLKFLEDELKPGDIVMTHHLPLKESIPARWEHSKLNAFYLCDCRYLIEDRKPALWIHGHTHTRQDYVHGSTRIVCNPRGMPGSYTVKHWDKTKVIDV